MDTWLQMPLSSCLRETIAALGCDEPKPIQHILQRFSVLHPESPHSKRRRRMISDVSDSADMIIAFPSRSKSF